MRDRIVKMIATFFYVGYLPIMPGTWASMAAAFIYLSIRDNVPMQIAVFFGIFVTGLVVAGRAEELLGKRDDQRIVIDEVSGMFLLYILIPNEILYLVLGFFLFRAFDIFKIAPMRRLENLPKSWGVMSDDILAALYSYVAIFLFMAARRFLL
jgi:phosphatidylglycerophosphatase A